MGIVFGYNLVGVAFVRAFMPDYKQIAEQTNALEAKLKFVHSRIVQHAESIAFFGGDSFEKAVADKRADDLWKVRKTKIDKDIIFGSKSRVSKRTLAPRADRQWRTGPRAR